MDYSTGSMYQYVSGSSGMTNSTTMQGTATTTVNSQHMYYQTVRTRPTAAPRGSEPTTDNISYYNSVVGMFEDLLSRLEMGTKKIHIKHSDIKNSEHKTEEALTKAKLIIKKLNVIL
jgi:hypothetical protein